MIGPEEKYCFQCASVLPRDALRCTACGERQPEVRRRSVNERYCTECGRISARSAPECPHCGVLPDAGAVVPSPGPVVAMPRVAPAPAPHASGWPWYDHALVGAVLICIAGLALHQVHGGVGEPPPSPAASASARPARADDKAVFTGAVQLVARHHRAPAETFFPESGRVTPLPDGSYEVSSFFEASNSRGAVVRTYWLAVVRRDGDGWSLERLNSNQ